MYRSLKEEAVDRASHDHLMYLKDNEKVFNQLEEATRGTKYSTVAQPHQRNKDGRAFYFALINQYAGPAAWDKQVDEAEDILHNSKWRGNGNFLLESHVNRHRGANNKLAQAKVYKPEYQLPDLKSCWRYLKQSIETSDAALQAAIQTQNQKYEDDADHDWEAAAGALIAVDPVAKKVKTNKRLHSQIGGLDGGVPQEDGDVNISSIQLKQGKGKSGVEFRFYTEEEYRRLPAAQKKELYKWRRTEAGKKTTAESKARSNKKSKGDGVEVSSAKALKKEVRKEVKVQLEKESKEGEEKEAMIAKLMTYLTPSVLKAPSAHANAGSVAFQSPVATPAAASVSCVHEQAKNIVNLLLNVKNPDQSQE